MMDKRKKVLLIGRDNTLCSGIRNMLKKEVYHVDFTYNAGEAFTKIQNARTDLVLLDCDSSGINIPEFISFISASARNKPGILAMINCADGGCGSDYTLLAVDDVITKPLNSVELQCRIHRILVRRCSAGVPDAHQSDSETFLEIMKNSSSAQTNREILHTIVRKVAIRMNATRCSIIRATCGRKFARIIASYDGPDIHSGITLDNYPEIKKALETKDAVVAHSVCPDPLMKDVRDKRKFLKGHIIVVLPILLKGDAVGVLFLRSSQEKESFTESTLKVLKMVACIVASVLDNVFLHESLESARSQLTQSERLRVLGELATGVIHDFNNVLSGILGHIHMLLSRNVDAATCERLQTIEKLVLDGSDVVRRVREFTGICASKEFATININDMVNDVVRMTEPKWSGDPEHAEITVRVDVDSTATPVVEGNASELREVFTNILFNAVDAMPKGGKLTIQTRTNGRYVSVRFFDTGEGMSKETKRRVFEPFFTTKGSRGMGLGMSVAQEIIKRHHGRIVIDSERGVGTVVTVRLPLPGKLTKKMEVPSVLKKSKKTKALFSGDDEIVPDALVENFIN